MASKDTNTRPCADVTPNAGSSVPRCAECACAWHRRFSSTFPVVAPSNALRPLLLGFWQPWT
eukprot:1144823-Pelagomonas_calceolata.AAC.2